jgi:hypothetical protein
MLQSLNMVHNLSFKTKLNNLQLHDQSYISHSQTLDVFQGPLDFHGHGSWALTM